MMLRERQGVHTSTILLIRVVWDPVRKRSAQRTLGSFSRYVEALPDELAGPDSPLTDAEKAQARAWIADRIAKTRSVLLPGLARRISVDATDLAEAVEDPERADAALKGIDHLALYGALDRLAKALRRHGLTRPSRKKASVASETPADTESLTSA